MSRALALTTALALPLTATAADPLDAGTRFTMSVGLGNTPGQPAPTMSNRLGVALGPVVAFGTLGMHSGGTHLDGETRSSRVYVPGIGLRYHFRSMAPKKASPYIVASTYTKKMQSDVQEDIDKLKEDVKKFGFGGAFGGEYAFTEAMSMSGEVGLAHDVMKYDENDVVFMRVSTELTSTVLVNFYF